MGRVGGLWFCLGATFGLCCSILEASSAARGTLVAIRSDLGVILVGGEGGDLLDRVATKCGEGRGVAPVKLPKHFPGHKLAF